MILHKFKKFRGETITLKPNKLSLIVGKNNSGKSSILHAIATWQFCKSIILFQKGIPALLQNSKCQGVGMSLDQFLPVAIPALNHLWTNLKSQKTPSETDGYTLKIGCKWNTESNKECYLEFGLSLANDRLFIKKTKSNIEENDKIPNVAYLPAFAGILDKENKVSYAERTKLIGKGLAGSILRNTILDMNNTYMEERQVLQGEKKKLSKTDRKKLQGSSWMMLQKAMGDIFNRSIDVAPFNDSYNTHINVYCNEGTFKNEKFEKTSGVPKRDIMVEGSGFLQWLSVYSLVLDDRLDVILLDEPDAHLHASLQLELFEKLEDFVKNKKKQIIISTHSTELIKHIDHSRIIGVDKEIKYLSHEAQKTTVIRGLGSEFAPILDMLQIHKNLLIVEGDFDETMLKIWSNTLGFSWPSNLVILPTAEGHKERKYSARLLKMEIPELKIISLRDRDDKPNSKVTPSLWDKDHPFNEDHKYIRCFTWKRKNIENYLFCPSAIARASGRTIDEVNDILAQHALAIPQDFTKHNPASTLLDCDGKKIIKEEPNSITKKLNCTRDDIATAMTKAEICDDVKLLIGKIQQMCSGDDNWNK